MLSVGNTALGSGASLSLDTRAALGASVLAANANVSSAAADTAASSNAVTLSLPDQQVSAAPLYNAFEFIYRTDYGKIILREQNAETGQEVTQIPSEYHLQQYAATQRAQRVQQQARLLHLEGGGGQSRQGSGTRTVAAGATGGKPATPAVSTGQGAPAPAPTPQAAAPAAPVVATAAAPAHVDIKV
jgi:hypothetical protein